MLRYFFAHPVLEQLDRHFGVVEGSLADDGEGSPADQAIAVKVHWRVVAVAADVFIGALFAAEEEMGYPVRCRLL